MSHTTKISAVQIKDAAAIRKAVQTLQNRGVKVELKENVKPRMYYERQANEIGNCDFVLHLPNGRFDVGLKKDAKTGIYDVFMDEWDGIVAKDLKAACPVPRNAEEKALWAIGAFSQEYAKEAAINAAMNAGYYVESANVDAKTGEVALVLAGM